RHRRARAPRRRLLHAPRRAGEAARLGGGADADAPAGHLPPGAPRAARGGAGRGAARARRHRAAGHRAPRRGGAPVHGHGGGGEAVRKCRRVVILLLPLLAAAAAAAEPVTPAATRPATATGTVVVPDQFLRRWDPVTVFFARDVGPAKGGPEDHPERLLTLSPPHPGAFTWLDARTLQFPTAASRSPTTPRSRSPRSPSRPPSRSAWSSWAAARPGTRRSGTAPIP